jgi:type II secretory ATPase GspE/PulE/Tfp pilus assembly ATPase PilB-like protein
MHLMPVMAAISVGGYVNLWKLLPIAVALLIWAKLLTWMDKDAIEAHLPRMVLNSIMTAVLILGTMVFLFMPSYPVALSVFLFSFVVDLGLYLGLRHQKVGLGDLKKTFITWVKSIGKGKGEKEVKVAEGAVGLFNKAGKGVEPPDAENPDAVAYEAVQKMLADQMRRHAEQINLLPQEGAAAVQFIADGVPYNATGMSKDEASAAVTYLKKLSGLDLNELRKPQKGKMKLQFAGKKYDAEITSAGSTAGESVSVGLNVKQRHNFKLQDLGFSDDQFTAFLDVIHEPEGIVLLAAPKGQGLTSLLYGVLRMHDAFVQHIQTVERDPPIEMEGIKQNILAPGAGATEEARLIDWVCSQEPHIVGVGEAEDPRSIQTLLKYAAQGRRVYLGMRAGTTFEALDHWRKLIGDDPVAMKDLRYIVAGRVVRKLCMACKVGYTPDPETLRRYNMSPDKVGKLFQQRTQPLRDPKGNPLVCEFCQDMRFMGRVGVFETFSIDDEVKQAVIGGGTINQLKSIFRKQRQKLLQEAGLSRVEAGDTSVQEVARVMGSGTSGGSSGKGGASSPKQPAPQQRPPVRKK